MLYKRKPFIVPEGISYYPKFQNDTREYNVEQATEEQVIKTIAGEVTAYTNDYILTDNSCSEKWVCKASDFDDYFEAV